VRLREFAECVLDLVASATPGRGTSLEIGHQDVALASLVDQAPYVVCLGAPLARAEGAIALTRLLAHYPHMRLATDPDALAWRTSTLIRGLDTLPVQLR